MSIFRHRTPIDDVAQLLKHMETFYTDENIPPHLVHRLIGSIKEPSHALAVIKKLPQLPKDVLVSVPSEVWNDFFIQTCNGPLTNVQYANQVHGIISDNDIPVLNKTLLMFAMLLLKDGTRATCKAAMEIIGRIQLDDVTENDVTDELSEFIASYVGSEKLHSVLDSYRIVRILIKSKRFLMEEKLISVVDSLRREACYQEIYDIIVEVGVPVYHCTCRFSSLIHVRLVDFSFACFSVSFFHPFRRVAASSPLTSRKSFSRPPIPFFSCRFLIGTVLTTSYNASIAIH